MTSEAIEKMRAEFQKWHDGCWRPVPIVNTTPEQYALYAEALAWLAWQASRSRVLEEAAQPWISVETRLPRVHKDVWVWVEFHNYGGRLTESWLEEDGTWAMGSAQDYTVTHWMPLPAPPRCADCDEAAKHAYSDATTPGFFDPNCKKHRKSKAGLSGVAQEEKP